MRYDLSNAMPTQLCQTITAGAITSLSLGGAPNADPANQIFYLTSGSTTYTKTWPNPALQPNNVSTLFSTVRTVPAWSQEIIYAVAPRSVSAYNTTSSGRRERWSAVWKNKLEAGSDDTFVVGLPVRMLVGANVPRGWIYACVSMTTAADTGLLVAFRNTSGAIPWTLSANTTTIPCSNRTVLTSADGNSILVSWAAGAAMYRITDLATPPGNATASVSLLYSFQSVASTAAGGAKLQLPASSSPGFAPVLLEHADGSVVALIGDSVVKLPTSASRAAQPGVSDSPAAGAPSTAPASVASNSGDPALSTIAIVFLALLALVFLVLCGLVAWLLIRRSRKASLHKTTQTSSTSLDPERGPVTEKDGSDRDRSASIFSRLAGAHSATHAASMLNGAEGLDEKDKRRMSILDESEEQPLGIHSRTRRVSLLEEIDAELTPPGTLAAISELQMTGFPAEDKASDVQGDPESETVRPVSSVTVIPDIAPAAEDNALSPTSPTSVKSDPTRPSASQVARSVAPRSSLDSTTPLSSSPIVAPRPSADLATPLSTSASTYHTAQTHPEGASLSSTSSSFHTAREQHSSSSSSDEAWSVDEDLYSPLSDPIEIPQTKGLSVGKKALNRKANFPATFLTGSGSE
ncbi:hypothetical protein HDU86_005689 [Geranomyces michiganensis]|nr:hypothetical protein HDU86_005689 [Geranomyces michiganensis]